MKLISSNHTQKRFKGVYIYKTNGSLILNESSFLDITFDNFVGRNIDLIHNKAFGKTTEFIKNFINSEGFINHKPKEYDIWNVLSSLVNVENIDVELNITEIPTKAFSSLNGRQSKLTNITITASKLLTIKQMAFYNLDNLTYLNFKSKINTIEKKAFAFNKSSTEKLLISFENEICGTMFNPNSFDGLQRPIQINFQSDLNYLPELTFKKLLQDQNNDIKINRIKCKDCKNYWMTQFLDKKIDANCIEENIKFSSESSKVWFESNCRINYILIVSIGIGVLFIFISMSYSVFYFIKRQIKSDENQQLLSVPNINGINIYEEGFFIEDFNIEEIYLGQVF